MPTRQPTTLLLCSFFSLAVLAASGCSSNSAQRVDGSADSDSAAMEVPRIACVFNSYGPVAEIDGAALNGVLLAREERRGTPWQIDVVSVAGATSAAKKAVAALGCCDSDELRSAFAPFAAETTPFLVVGATDPCLALLPGGKHLSFASYSDAAQGSAMADFAHDELGVQRVTVLFEAPGDFPIAVSQAFIARARALQGMSVASIAFTDVAKLPTDALLASKPQAVYLACLPGSAVLAIKSLRSSGFSGSILGADSFDIPLIADESLGSARYFSTHAWFGAGASAAQIRFASRYREMFHQEPSAFSALGYDAMQAMDRALASLPPDRRTRQGIAASLRALAPHQGVSGEIAFPAAGHFSAKPVFVVRASQGQRELSKRMTPTTVPEANCAR